MVYFVSMKLRRAYFESKSSRSSILDESLSSPLRSKKIFYKVITGFNKYMVLRYPINTKKL